MQTLILIHLGNMNRGLKSQLMNVFLFLQLPQEDRLRNQHVNRKCLLRKRVPRTKLMKDYIKDL